MKNKNILLFLLFLILNLVFFGRDGRCEEKYTDILLYNEVVYDLSSMTVDYRPEFLTFVLEEINAKVFKKFKKHKSPRIHGVKMVPDYAVLNGAEVCQTPDGKFVLFLSELMVDDYRNIPRAVCGLKKLTDSDIRGMHIQAKRQENLDAILEGKDQFSDTKDEESFVGGLVKAQSSFITGITNFINDVSGKDSLIVRDYHQSFNVLFPKNKIKSYSIQDRKNKSEVAALFVDADALLETGDLEGALALYEKAIWVDPRSVEVYNRRGILFLKMEKYQRSFDDFSKALEIDGNSSTVFNNRGDLYFAVNDFEKAIEDYSSAIDIDPNYAEAYFNRGYAQDQRNYFYQAIENYTKAIELIPGFAQSYSNRGYVYYKLKNFSKADKDFSMAILIDPNFGEAYANRALINFFQEEYEESWADVLRCEQLAIELEPQFLVSLEEVYPRP